MLTEFAYRPSSDIRGRTVVLPSTSNQASFVAEVSITRQTHHKSLNTLRKYIRDRSLVFGRDSRPRHS